MPLRTFSFLPLAGLMAFMAGAQVPAPALAAPLEPDPPLVQVPGASLHPSLLKDSVLPPVLYPGLAHLCRVEGNVTVRLILGVEGVAYPVGDAEGPPLLREAGRDFVRSIRFEPVQIDGRKVRAVTTASVPFRLQGADAGPASTGFLLKLDTGAPELGHALGMLETRLRAWLAGIGLTDRAGTTAEPTTTLLVNASMTKAMPGKPDPFLTLKFRSLEDKDKAESSLVPGRRILAYGCRFGNGTAAIGDEVIASQIQGLLDQIVRPWERPAKVREAETRLVAEMASGRPIKAQTFEFAKMRVRLQPPAPRYPSAALIARIQGTVVVEMVIDEQGLPLTARAIEGPAQLRAAAESYALSWQFEPAKVDGVPVRARFKLIMPFKLH